MRFCPQCGCELSPAEVDGRTRQKCTSASCDYVFWDNPTPVVAAIVELDGKVVLARDKRWPEKMYGLITGFLEREETPETSVLREVREELGLAGEIVSFVGSYSFFEKNQLLLVFHIQARGELTLGDELAEVKLVSPEKLRPWPVGTGPALRDWLEERRASGDGLEGRRPTRPADQGDRL